MLKAGDKIQMLVEDDYGDVVRTVTGTLVAQDQIMIQINFPNSGEVLLPKRDPGDVQSMREITSPLAELTSADEVLPMLDASAAGVFHCPEHVAEGVA